MIRKLFEELQEDIKNGRLVVSDGISSIKNSELSGNIEIKEINLPSSLTIIDDNALAYTDNLKEVICYGNIQYVGTSSFEESGINKIEFKQNCSSINDRAFYSCKKLREVVCRDLCNVSLGEKVFYHCESLREINLSNSLQEIKYGTFFRCKSLSKIDLPKALQNIRGYAFAGCESLTSIDLPNTLKTIEDHAFDSCRNLTYVSIPSSVSILENKIFNRCSRLQKVDLPDTLKLLDMSCFLECSMLKEVVVGEDTTVVNESLTPYIKVEK